MITDKTRRGLNWAFTSMRYALAKLDTKPVRIERTVFHPGTRSIVAHFADGRRLAVGYEVTP